MFAMHNELGDKSKDCSLGVLVMENVENNPSDKLYSMKRGLEKRIREKYGQADRKVLKALHPMDVYVAYYKRFGYTYHLLSQTESVARGKYIPNGLSLVEAMFMAELKNMLLTAGHDLEKIKTPLCLKSSAGVEHYTAINGKEATTIPGDILLADKESVISSILRGPDLRTAIAAQTRHVLYAVYAPYGVEEELVCRHLDNIEGYVRIFSENSRTCLKQMLSDNNN